MRGKRLLTAVAAAATAAVLALPAYADYRDFGGRSQINWSDCTKGWGQIKLEEGKILKKGEGGKIENINTNYSVFNKLSYNRGKDFYSGFSDHATFAYDTNQTIYGASLGGGKYFYAVYDDANDKNNYKVDFAARFDSNLQKCIKKGDIEIAIAAEACNYKGTSNKHRAVANLRMYSNASSIQQEITTTNADYDGARTVTAGWMKLNSDITRTMINLRSERNRGLKKFNKSYLSKVRIYLRDNVGPKTAACGIYNGGSAFKVGTNAIGNTVNTAGIGDKIYYYVEFDEKVKITDGNKVYLRLRSDPDKNTDSAKFDAKFIKMDGDRAIFEYKIPDRTGEANQLKPTAETAKLIGKDYITDIAGNPLEDDAIRGFTNKVSPNSSTDKRQYTVDDTKPLLHERSFTDNSSKFYPTVSIKTRDKACNIYGSIPEEILTNGSAKPQNTMFGKSDTTGPVFRIVLDDEIKKDSLGRDTKLKLQVYDADRKPTSGYVYADLIGARTVGLDNKCLANGVKSDAMTELYFRYTPKAVDGMPIYRLNFAGSYDESGSFVFDADAITTGGARLKNISGISADGSVWKIGRNYLDLMPLAAGVMIDTEAPEFVSSSISKDWSRDINTDAALVFEDAGGFASGASISLVYYKDGEKHSQMIKNGKNGRNAASLLLAVQTQKGNSDRAKIDLSNISLVKEYPADYQLYLEYSVSDASGNTTTNKDKKNLRVYLDNTAPRINGVKEEYVGSDVFVTYDVTDTGVGEISPLIEYTLENLEKNTTEDNLKTNDAAHQVKVTPEENSYDIWRVSASFADTVGNRSAKSPSGVFATSTRKLVFEFTDSADSVVSDKHSVKVKQTKIPENSASYEISYGWKRGAAAGTADAKSTVTFRSSSEFEAFDFASESIQRQYNAGKLFDGEFTLIVSATLKPDNSTCRRTQSFFFDTTSPTGTITATGAREGVNTSYDVVYNLTDDAAQYKNGAYVETRNIDFSEQNKPVMTLYIGGEAAKTYRLDTFNASETIDFASEFGSDEKYRDAKSAYVEIEFADKFGNKATEKSGEMLIDFAPPEIVEIEVTAKNGKAFERTADGAYIINDTYDIGAIIAAFDDAAGDKLDVCANRSGYYTRTRLDDYVFTAQNLLRSDFRTMYKNGALHYIYNIDVIDMGGNSASGSVEFVMDNYAPGIYYSDTDSIMQMTNAESVTVQLNYRADDYEQTEDITVDVSGAEVAEHSETGIIKLRITDNGNVKLRLTDRQGKTGEKNFAVSCFDRTVPEISFDSSEQTPEQGAAKYGSVSFTAYDNDSLTVLGVAVTAGEPTDGDFFSDVASNRAVIDEDGNEEYDENGYFGDASGNAFATLTLKNTGAGTSAASACYKLSYGALPDGTYGIYARVGDNAGNVTVKKLCEIETTSADAAADIEYSPTTPTGGSVSVKVSSDIPTRVMASVDAEYSIDLMHENAQKRRDAGYTYTFDSVTTTLSFDEAIERYNEIADKYAKGGEGLTAEDKYLVNYNPTSWDGGMYNYINFLTEPQYVDPVGDMLDYLVNECLCNLTWENPNAPSPSMDPNAPSPTPSYEQWTYPHIDTENGPVTYMAETDTDGEIYRTLNDIGLFERKAETEPVIDIPEVRNGVADLKNYPEAFDKFGVPTEIDSEKLTLSTEPIRNPFYSETVTEKELLDYFGEDFDLSLIDKNEEGSYINPFGDAWEIDPDTISDELKVYMVFYDNPFGGYSPLRERDIAKGLWAIGGYQRMRETAVEACAEKYIKTYMAADGKTFAREHTLSFVDNINTQYALCDELGRKIPLPILIDWIDHTAPYVPQKNITFSVNGEPLDAPYTNAAKARVEVTLPDDGIYAQYRLSDLPEGAVGTRDGDSEDDAPLYRSFYMDVTDNTQVEFFVSNPTMSEDKYRQVYNVNRFDRTAPTCEVEYSAARPSDGSLVNHDVTVSLADISDNRSALANVTVTDSRGNTVDPSYTFSRNGSFTFVLKDEAGNMSTIPVSVDYIDKTPVKLSASFTSGTAVLSDKDFDITVADSDYTNTSYTYKYKGGYLANDVEAIIYAGGEQVKLIKIGDDDEYTYEYSSKAKNLGKITISGILFDKEAPAAEVSYEQTPAAHGTKNFITASVKLTDNINQSSEISLVSIAGMTSEKSFARTDVKIAADGSRTLVFDSNGYADLVFADKAGNTTEVRLNVSSLDRSIPRAFISYSKTTPTNSDVIANISLNKLCDYQVYGDGKLLKDYTGAYSNSIVYTFEQNCSRVFKFRDTSGNETAQLLATVDNIDKVKPEVSAEVIYNKMATDGAKSDAELAYYPGAATIKLTAMSAGDVLEGGDSDTILMQNTSQSRYHTVMANGRYAIKFMDNAGNFDTLYVDIDGIDTSKPTATDSGNPTEWVCVAPTITVTPNAKANGIKTYIVENGVKLDSTSITPTENGVYTFMVTDEIGNSSTHRVTVDRVDTNAPTITVNNEEKYGGRRDIYIKAGGFDKAAFENVTAADGESGLAGELAIDYGSFDQNVPGLYPVTFTVSDIAGNTTVLTRNIRVIGPDDVFAAVNGELMIPGEQKNFLIGDALELTFVNADRNGNKVSYALAEGYYNGAQMKGKKFKALSEPDAKIKLDADKPGLYTLFMQTENRNIQVTYLFIEG